MTHSCCDCARPVTKYSKGRCRSCASKAVNRDRAVIEKRNNTLRTRAVTKKAEVLTPATTSMVRALLREHSVSDTYAALKRREDGQPVTYNQVRQQVRFMHQDVAVEALAALTSAAALVTRTPAKRPLTFEEQLARVAAGAALVPTFRPSRPDPSRTLGGVATGML